MDNATALVKYLQSGATICSYCNGKIIKRDPFPDRDRFIETIPLADDWSSLKILIAECEQGHLWMEFYDGEELKAAWGKILTKITEAKGSS